MSDRTLAQEWLEYVVRVVPNDAPPVQRTETRRAFYAGAHALFGLMTSRLDPGAEPTERDLAYVDRLLRELNDFKRAVAAGHA